MAKQLLTSRRLWTAVIAMVINLATIIIGIYVKDPDYTKLAIAALTGLDTVAGIVVALFTYDDVTGIKADKEIQIAAIDAGVHPDYPVTDKSIEANKNGVTFTSGYADAEPLTVKQWDITAAATSNPEDRKP